MKKDGRGKRLDAASLLFSNSRRLVGDEGIEPS